MGGREVDKCVLRRSDPQLQTRSVHTPYRDGAPLPVVLAAHVRCVAGWWEVASIPYQCQTGMSFHLCFFGQCMV